MKMPRHAFAVVFAITAVLITVTGRAPEGTRAASPPPGTIDTLAGGGSLTGDNIPATSAALTFPYGVAVNSVGDVFFSDVTRCSVRKVSNGLISTAVGTGVCADYLHTYSGDGGPATAAMLNRPAGLAFDGTGNLYIADSFNCSIRKVEARTGTITTVAGHGPAGCGGVPGDGGPATQANMLNPVGVAVDGAGNLYFADSGNCRVRRVSNGVISTVAGIGIVNASCTFGGDGGFAVNAGLSSPQGIAVDGAGNLYIADSCRIREVSGGIINTVAGTTFCYYNGDGLATSALLNQPVLLAVDSAGNLFIADSGNCLVRRLSGGMLTTVAGLQATFADMHFTVCGFSGDGGPATAAELGATAGVAVDGGGNLYITDLGDLNNPGHARVRIVYGSTPPASGTTNVPPVLAVPAAQSGQYSDPLSFGVSASDADGGDTLVLSAAGLPYGLAFTDNGNGTARVSGTVLAPAGTYTATLWASDGSLPPVAAAVSIVVSSEDATLTYTGDALVRTGWSTTLSASVTQAADGSPGDITKASVLFDLSGLISGTTTTYGPLAFSAAGQASLMLPAGLPADLYSVTARIDPANGYYTAAGSASTLLVYDPGRSASGSGWVTDSGAKSDFSFSAKYGPGGSPQGQLQYSFVDGGQTMKVKMASPSWLVARGRTAVFGGAATVNGASGYRVVVTVIDNGRGSLDTYGTVVSRADGTLLHALTPILLGGGSLLVQ